MVSPSGLIAWLPTIEVGNPAAFLALLGLVPLIVALAWTSRRGMRRERRRAATALRLTVVTLLVLAAADPRLRVAADRLAVGFLVDVSDSITPDARAEALRYVGEAVRAAAGDDQATLVAFAGDAFVERPAGPWRDVPPISSNPPRTATDLAAALRVGLGALPTDRARRLVLLSDGNENRGKALDEARVAAAAGIPIDYVVLGETRGPEVLVRAVDAPSALREGDTFTLRLTIESTIETTARLRLMTDGRLDETNGGGQLTGTVPIHPGTNSLVLPHEPLGPGFHTFRVQIEPAQDTIAENNEAIAFTSVSGRPRVLVVEATRGEARYLVDALRAGGLEPSVVPPVGLSADLSALRGWDGVVLVNTPASALSLAQMRTLKTFVQTLGGGLTLVGGDRAFVLGGYQRTPLEEMSPVSMQRRGARAQSSVALMLVIDTSGSMGDNVGGVTKMDLAKDAALGAIDLLTPTDQLGIVAFEDRPRSALDMDQIGDASAARSSVQKMSPGGGTAIYPAVEMAFDALAAREAKVKHIVLLTDGISPGGDYAALTRRMREANVTLSTIGIGNDVDINLLQQLADMGSGRYYEGSDPFQVPQILVKETLEIARTAIVEEPFRPTIVGSSPMLDGLTQSALPALQGYLALTPKPASLVVLGTRQGDPLLIEWQYGLGQVVAWTSDALNRWSAGWIEWPEFSRFWSQAVKRTVPARVDQNVQTTVSIDGDRARVTVDALDDDRSFRNFMRTTAQVLTPAGVSAEIGLRQSGPGRYEGTLPLGAPGAYLLQVTQRDPKDDRVVAVQSTGFVTAAAPEYWQLRPNRDLLTRLARASGGRVLQSPTEAFRRDLRAPGTGLELWPSLVGAAMLLFLADVAVRRLRISFAGVQVAADAVRARLRPARTAPTPAPALARLLAARGRPTPTAAASASLAARLAASRAETNRTTRPLVRPPGTTAVAGAPRLPTASPSPRSTPPTGAPASPTARAPDPPRTPPGRPRSGASPTTPTTTTGGDTAVTGGGTAARLLAAKQRAREQKR